jgi:rRNA pseudouridine-1189 N-methylase Emg1 (Nep1/Mra1 family)
MRSIKLKSNLPRRRNRFISLPSNLLCKLRVMSRKLAKLKSKSKPKRPNLRK